MLVKLVEVNWKTTNNKYEMKEIYVNPESVVSVRSDDATNKLLAEGALPWDLHEEQSFCIVTLRAGAQPENITVVGTPAQIVEKCYASRSRLLKG
jgi:hypothetical protein